ncbi:DNA cytosine methyltransferase [Anoxybacterium hadale]|uniref:DNA cytosine methyltransferase n=1 Tax=Anoxybacterium hadale TaxID=3408580 RepID=A0ACD1AA52_9FIRM|nr:DNA cytosine methyltransferase [Clostridiales bacterium]
MNSSKSNFIGVDLFAGAGGLSLGAQMAGVKVALAVEKELYAAATYTFNHPHTKVIIDDIKNIRSINIESSNNDDRTILFGGPPCQGFSSSNQRTRNRENPSNWLLDEFLRIVDLWKPDWVVFENVYGFVNTENKLFLHKLVTDFENKNYTTVWYILNAADYGVPQRRMRFFLIASKHGYKLNSPHPITDVSVNVQEAIYDLPKLSNGANNDYMQYKCKEVSEYASLLRNNLSGCSGHLVTKNALHIIERYSYIPQGGNWKDIPESLMGNYSDRNRCHQGIYHRLNSNEPAITIGNYRKAMLIHPWENRGLSVREAARIQSFPDSYEFKGSLGFQQQQVGNAVPPLLAKVIFSMIMNGEYRNG